MKETTNYKMNLVNVMEMLGINDVRYIKRKLEDRYRISARRIWIENDIVLIYNPNPAAFTNRMLKDGFVTC